MLVLAAALGAGLITRLKNWFNPSKKGNTNMFKKFKADDGTFSPVTKPLYCCSLEPLINKGSKHRYDPRPQVSRRSFPEGASKLVKNLEIPPPLNAPGLSRRSLIVW